jgi:uncharacterized protein
MRTYFKLRHGLTAFVCIILYACGQDQEATPQIENNYAAAPAEIVQESAAIFSPKATLDNRQFNIDNTQYLFDVSDHTPAELEALLTRAEEIRETHAQGYNDLDIVLVLHGPDINIFRQENYIQHKPLVDLAAKLDAFEIIDMKICETSMSKMGIERSEVPAFIESVPYAPDEIRRLGDEGYIKL